MLDLPESTIFNKRIPKQKFYDNLSVTSQLKKIFVEQISQIIWRNKISPTTINISAGEIVAEIEVIVVKLNKKELDKRVLQLIDKEIPYHILFLLEYSNEIQAWICYKEPTKSTTFKTGVYYHTDWLVPESLNLRIDGLDMDMLYENFIRQIAGERLGDVDTAIKEAITRDEQQQKLLKEITKLEKKAMTEKQPRRKWELAEDIRKLKEEMEK